MENLKALREKAKLTQEEVASHFGNLDRSTVAKWETGESKPRADKLPELAKLYQCSIDELYNTA